MTFLWPIVALLGVGTSVLYVRARRVGKPLVGRVSRWLAKRLGFPAVYRAQIGCSLALLAYDWTPHPSPLPVLAFLLWILDDALGSGDDEPRKKRDWAKAKLRSFAPVRLRPVERWAPA
jgi:hypothetical protein